MRRRNLDNLREFWRALAAGEISTVMQLLAPGFRIVAHGHGSESMNARGSEEVRRYFEMIFAAGVSQLEYDIDQILVDAQGACTVGRVRIPYPGRMLRVLGHDVDDPDACYLYETRVVMIWAIDEHGNLREQASYTGGDGFDHIGERKLAPDGLALPRD